VLDHKVEAGRVYHVGMDGACGAEGVFELRVTFVRG
jgi:hypothetical protein